MAITQRGSVLEAGDAADSDNFGRSIAISGNGLVMAVGSPNWEGATGSNRGGVYIYDKDGTSWTQRGSVLEASDATDLDNFGISCSLNWDGSVLIVGTHARDGVGGTITNSGGIYTFDWGGSSWSQRGSVLEASDAAIDDNFGIGCALSGDGLVLAVGAYLWEGGAVDQGGVYIYDKNGTSWTQRGSVLTASDAAASDRFGISVSLSHNGNILVVGAQVWEGTTGTDRGGVYTYDRNGSSWTQRGSVLFPSDAADTDYFGFTVSLSSNGEFMAIGSYLWEGITGTNRGGIYFFKRKGSAWEQYGSVLEASDAADSDNFGMVSISAGGSVVVVGASNWEGATGSNIGGVYTYDWKKLTGSLTESLDIEKWGVAAINPINNDINYMIGESGVTSYEVFFDTNAPGIVIAYPHIDGKWTAATAIPVGYIVCAVSPDTTPHLWKCTTSGTTHASTEPTWNLSGTTTDNTVTWTYIGALVDPVALCAKMGA